jgi:hypothetical protein
MLLWHIEENRMIYCKSTHFHCVLIFSSFEEDVRQLKIVPLKNCNKRLLTFVCQSLIVVTSTYPNYLFRIYSMISHFDAHCDFNILFLLLTLSVPVIMAVVFVIL